MSPWIGLVLSQYQIDRVLVLVLSDVLSAYQAMDRFSIDSAKSLHSCSNSIDTPVLDYSHPFLGCEEEIQTSLFLLGSSGKLHLFIQFSKDVWSNLTRQRALAVEHAINWLTV